MLSLDEVRSLRARSQRLSRRDDGGDPAAIVRAIGAIQSQDSQAAALALRARGSGFTAAAVEQARVDDRAVVRTWSHRGTMHLIPAEDVRWLVGLLGPALLKARERRFAEMGLNEDLYAAALRALEAMLGDGPLTRAEIGERWLAAGIDASGNRLTHMITRAALELHVCDGPDRGRERTWVRLADWIPADPGPQGDAALAELARRHLAGHGPAAAADLAAWSGLGMTAARRAWSLIAGQVQQVETSLGAQWVLNGTPLRAEGGEPSAVRLLPAFDAYLLGYRDREVAVPPPNTKAVSAGGLRILPAVAVDGAVVGTWRLQRRGRGAQIEVEPFADSGFDRADAREEVADIGRFLGVAAGLRLSD